MAPLLGAGLDRIVHASYTEGIDRSTSPRVPKSPSNSSTVKPARTVDLLEPPR
ncbi:hypothetical protein [Streptomyces hydrogenans]|uniref:hypothetical protein n=1 Tax=Streptomyces hydrogenans TaxID=1873719 RepID=UPI001CFCF841|nr:hypothetical protein [Streptomyces hydrogenans]